MSKLLNIAKFKDINWLLFFYLLLLTQGVFFLKFLAFPLFFILNKDKFTFVTVFGKQYKFYVLIIIYATISSTILLFINFSLQYLVMILLGLFTWILCFTNNLIINFSVKKKSLKKLYSTIDFLFDFNIIVSVAQYLIMMIEYKTINPFRSVLGTSAGDSIKGIFANSSVNMIICSFAFIFYYSNKKNIKAVFNIAIMFLTTYMSGILIFFSIFSIFIFFASKLVLYKKLLIISAAILIGSLFYFISKENIDYAIMIGNTVLEDVPPRKITSFEQTFQNASSNISTLLFGNGMGNFSSRLAFIAGGEYVSWYPSSLVIRSDVFHNNHFQLWNYEVLSTPFSDGTANQPFSVFNQIVGEYGIIGSLILLVFYIGGYFFNSLRNKYSRFFLFLLLGFMFLDYWFEYFSVIVFFELINSYWQKKTLDAKLSLIKQK